MARPARNDTNRVRTSHTAAKKRGKHPSNLPVPYECSKRVNTLLFTSIPCRASLVNKALSFYKSIQDLLLINMESSPLKSTPPAKRQRAADVSTVDKNATRATPVVNLLSVPLSIIFQLQPQIASNPTPSKTKEKPLLSRAEAQAFLQVHYCAQDMDALIATAEAAFRQKLKNREYEQSICAVDHPMTRSLVPLLRRDSYDCLKYVPAELNNGILSNLERVAVSLKHFAEMNATTADNLADITGMESLADGKNKLSELQIEVSKRISALLAHQLTEDTNWCSMKEYCQRLFPHQIIQSIEVSQTKEPSNESLAPPAKRTSLHAGDNTVAEVSTDHTNGDHAAVVDPQTSKLQRRDLVVDRNVTFEDAVMADRATDHTEKEFSIPIQAHAHESTPSAEANDAHGKNHVSGFSLLRQAIHVQAPMESKSIDRSATKAEDPGVDKENSQSQHSQNDAALHPTLLIYGSQASQASSSHSLSCRPGTETQTAAALLNRFAVAGSKDSPDMNI